MKNTAIRILTLAFSLTLLLGVLPLSAAAEEAWDGSARTFKMKAGDEEVFIYTPSETGAHTIERQYSVIGVFIEPATDKDGYPEMIEVSGKASPNDECYRLTAGVPYRVRIVMRGFADEWPDGFEDTISIRPGMPVLETDLATPFPASGTLKLKVKAGEEIKYKFTPAESGTYVLYSENTVVNVQVRNSPNNFNTPEYQLSIANPFGKMFGYMLPLNAGETYLIVFSMWEGHTEHKNGFEDTYYLKKTDPLKSVSLRSAYDPNTTNLSGYVGGDIHLFGYTEPLYYQSTITDWSISDTDIAAFEADGSEYIHLKKAGTVTVTAKVAGQTATATITVEDRPELELNKTTKLTFGGSIGVECTFTPSESGNYRFSMTGGGGTTEIRETGAGTYWEGSGSLSAYLTAGKTYTLVGAFGPKDYTVKVTKSGSGSDNTTNALPSGDEPTDTTATTPSTSAPTQTQTPTETKPNKVPVHLENGKAQVKYEEVAHLLDGNAVTVTVEDTSVTAVDLPTQMLADAADSQTPLRIELPHATVALDAAILAKVAEQSEGDTIQLSVERMETTALSQQQQNTLKNKNVAAVVRIVLGGDTAIHDLGGTAAVTVPFTPAEGRNLSDYVVYYVDDGKLEKIKTTIVNGQLVFYTTHFSDYTVVYEPKPATTATTAAVKPDGKFPFDIGKTVLYASIALLIMVGAGVAIYIITKHQTNNNGKH